MFFARKIDHTNQDDSQKVRYKVHFSVNKNLRLYSKFQLFFKSFFPISWTTMFKKRLKAQYYAVIVLCLSFDFSEPKLYHLKSAKNLWYNDLQ